jgi:hypothetical protein
MGDARKMVVPKRGGGAEEVDDAIFGFRVLANAIGLLIRPSGKANWASS